MQNNNKPQLWFIGGGEVHASREAFLKSLQDYPYEIGGKYYDWKSWIASGLADTHQIIKPDFPNKQNADYEAWKIWFEKYVEKYIVSVIARSETTWQSSVSDSVIPSVAEEFLSKLSQENLGIHSSEAQEKGVPTAGQKINIIAHSLGGIFIAKYLSENTFPVKIKALHMVAPVFDDDGLEGEIVGNFAFDPENLKNLAHQVELLHFWHSKDDPVVPYSHSENFQEYLPNSTFHNFHTRGHFANQAHFVELFNELL